MDTDKPRPDLYLEVEKIFVGHSFANVMAALQVLTGQTIALLPREERADAIRLFTTMLREDVTVFGLFQDKPEGMLQ